MFFLKKLYKIINFLFSIIYVLFFSLLLYLSIIVEKNIFLFFTFFSIMLIFGLLYVAITRYNNRQRISITINDDIALIETFSTIYRVSVYENLVIKKTSFRYIVIFNQVKLHLLQDGFLFNKINSASDYLNKDFFPNATIYT